MNLRLSLLACTLCLAGSSLMAQKSIADANPVVEDFTGFTAAGFAPSPGAGQLDSDEFAITGLSEGTLTFGGTQTAGDFARGLSAGGVSQGGVYAYNGADSFIFFQPSADDFTPGTLTVRYVNNHPVNSIDNLELSYQIQVLNDGARSTTWNLSWSLDDVTYTSVPALDYATPLAADTPANWVLVNRMATIDLSASPVGNGGFIYLRFSSDDNGGSGSRDEIGLDNLVVSCDNLPVELEHFSVQ